MTTRFSLVVAIDGGPAPKFPDRIGHWVEPCAKSLWTKTQSVWFPKAAELARKNGFELAGRWERWPAGWTHRACVYGAVNFRGTPSRFTSPYYFPARPIK